jgi:SPFH domain / Band 7 family
MDWWWIFLLVAVPIVALLVWRLLDDSVVRVEPGNLGLLLVRGKATDTALPPGPHWVPALRRRTVQVYPSVELSYRAGTELVDGGIFERGGPALRMVLGDRSAVLVAYTVRFRLDQARLRDVHNRFGAEGLWSAAADVSAHAVRAGLGIDGVGVEALTGPGRVQIEQQVGRQVSDLMFENGFTVTLFALADLDLGRTGQVAEAVTRARLELAREQAEAELRRERARNDADLATHLSTDLSTPAIDAALRYREVDVWRDVAHALGDRPLIAPRAPSARRRADTTAPPDEAPPGDADEGAAPTVVDEHEVGR